MSRERSTLGETAVAADSAYTDTVLNTNCTESVTEY